MATRQTLKIASLPVRMGGAAGLVALAYYAPWVAGTLIAVAVLAAATTLLMLFALRRAFRWRSRTKCSGCDYQPLRIARICPKCQTPVLLADIRAAPERLRASLKETAVCMVGADGSIDDSEVEYLRALHHAVDGQSGSDGVVFELVRQSAGDIQLPDALTAAEGEMILRVAASLIVANRSVTDAERTAYYALSKRLPVLPRRVKAVLREYESFLSG